MCFLDASKTFDRVKHSVLFNKLTRRGIPGYIVKLLSYWYAKQTMRVRWGDCISSPFRVSNGVRQGGILSPYLFNTTLLRPRQRLEPGTASSRSRRTPIGEQTPELSAPQPWLCVSPLLSTRLQSGADHRMLQRSIQF